MDDRQKRVSRGHVVGPPCEADGSLALRPPARPVGPVPPVEEESVGVGRDEVSS